MISETMVAYVCGAAICVAALACDGVTAQTLSIGVASLMCGGGGYIAGRYRQLRTPNE